ncbi:MAG: hypothetical protein JW787_04150 [Sedimentisphaerales bacterium]|nr:hypothetical protein [Sedimentisphaerales bacterium]
MLTLIKREIYDHIAYFIGALVFSLMTLAILVFAAYSIDSQEANAICIIVAIPIITVFVFGAAGMGVSQMYFDRNKKISAFLSTLPVTRNKILIARISAGILAISIFFLPLIITTWILHPLLALPVPILDNVFYDIYIVGLLMVVACYCIGLQTGWTTSRILPSLGGFLLTCILVTIIIVKGLSIQISLLLIIFIIASIIRVRQKFMSTSF